MKTLYKINVKPTKFLEIIEKIGRYIYIIEIRVKYLFLN